MALLNRKLQSVLISTSINNTPSFTLRKSIIVHSQSLTQSNNNDSMVNAISDSFKKTRFCVVESLLGSYNIVGSSPLVFDLLVQAYAKLRMFEDGFEKSGENMIVWKDYGHMIEKGKYPNEITIRTMISALCKEGKLQVVVDLLDRIHGKRCSPIVIVNTNLVFKVIEEGGIEEGMELLKRMLQKNLLLDSIAYSVVYTNLNLGNFELAWEVYEGMLKRGFSANSSVFIVYKSTLWQRKNSRSKKHVARDGKYGFENI
ncbi:hypothetical protein CRYUN_Cryun38cG0008300 [Craigia yunnanensis]